MSPHTRELSASELRQFGLGLAAIVAGLFGLFLPWWWGFSWPVWPWVVGILLAAWALLAPARLRPVYRGWMRVSHVIGRVMTPLVLGLTWAVTILPMGLVMKIIRRDPMHRHFEPGRESYFSAPESRQPDHFRRPF